MINILRTRTVKFLISSETSLIRLNLKYNVDNDVKEKTKSGI
jgi:hypothetical protein